MGHTKTMNSAPCIPFNEYRGEVKAGQLIGFKLHGEEITAAYPFLRKDGDRLTFILCYAKESGNPILDGCMARTAFINVEPIAVEIYNADSAVTFGQRLASFFLTPAPAV